MFDNIDIAIVTYNRKEVLLESISQIFLHHSDDIRKIHIIDNNSNDGTHLLEILTDPKINFVRLNENIGSAGGFAVCMNEFLKYKSNWLWLFNDDSYPQEGSVDLLKRATADRSELDKVGMIKISREVNGKSEILFWNGVRQTKFIPISNRMIKCDLVTFDGSLISKNLISTIGTCDPLYFMGIYEFDFCLRAKDADFEIFTIPNGTIHDLKMGSTGGLPPWRTYYITRNHLSLVLKRKSLKGFFQWSLRESKSLYGILLKKDKKLKRIYLKGLAIYHGLSNQLGKRIYPEDTRWD